MKKTKVLLMMSGSIAAYKVCQVISRLVQNGSEVQVVATPSALQFVGAATLEGLSGKKVLSDLFEAGEMMAHIHLMRWADVVLVAPATAHTINRMAQGLGEDLLTTLFLAHDFKKPFLIAPAMNTMMYLHPVTQKSIEALKKMGVEILETASGVLACGEVGWGRLLDPDLIQKEVESRFGVTGPSRSPQISGPSLKVLITAGGTQEPIDQVRVISNLSTGKTGSKLAQIFSDLGATVTLMRAENAVPCPEVTEVEFTSFSDFQTKISGLMKTAEFDVVIQAAAISDYSVEKIEADQNDLKSDGKISSAHPTLRLILKKNPKLISQIRSWSRNPHLLLIGFKMTASPDQKLQTKAITKLFKESGVDYVVHNDLSEMDHKAGKHSFHLYQKGESTATRASSVQELGQLLTQVTFERFTSGLKENS